MFVDYLYPRHSLEEVLTPKEINSYLNDGQGLYNDGELMWKITSWDIKYVECTQTSDHFHLDHKDYYTEFMHNYQYGLLRDDFISELYF